MVEKVIGEDREQGHVTEFYDSLVYPSRVSDDRFGRLANIKNGEVVGDFGCGQSLFYERFKGHEPEPVFLDVSEKTLESIDYGRKVRGDLQDLPFKEGSFDKIFCIGVIHHVPDPERAVREVSRVLKKGGLFVMGVYSDEGFQPRYRKLYERMGLLKGVGFRMGKCVLRIHHKGKGMTADEIELRARDWLKTPIVRYAPVSYWSSMLERAGLRVEKGDRISTMNILFGRKG
jgi:ubiquinone/menaquinone biosynthesis C-methylase UbiE